MKLFMVLCVFICVAGCTTVCPQRELSLPQDQIDYTLAIDHFSQTEKLDSLLDFVANYPDSPWSKRAAIVIRYANEIEQLKSQIKTLKAEKENYRLSEMKQRTALEQMKTEKQQLTEKLEKFKGILIQLEAQPQ